MTARWDQRHTWVAIVGVVVVLLLVVLAMSRGRANVTRAAQKMMNADTMHINAELVINLPERSRGRERPFTKMTVRLGGDMTRTDDRTPEFGGTLYFEARGRGNVFFADGQGRIFRDRVLFNLDNLPVFLNPSGSLVKRWTKVEIPLMQTRNAAQVQEALLRVMDKAESAGKESLGGESLRRFTITLTEEEEKMLIDVLHQSTSGNLALDVLARLLDSNVMKDLTVWVKGDELRQVRAQFVRPFKDAQGTPQEFDFATLTLRFVDYGKQL